MVATCSEPWQFCCQSLWRLTQVPVAAGFVMVGHPDAGGQKALPRGTGDVSMPSAVSWIACQLQGVYLYGDGIAGC